MRIARALLSRTDGLRPARQRFGPTEGPLARRWLGAGNTGPALRDGTAVNFPGRLFGQGLFVLRDRRHDRSSPEPWETPKR